MKTVFLFSGQGSQFFGMARPLFEANPVFRHALLELDVVARRLLRRSVVESIFEPKKQLNDPFDQTLITHPAILMTQLALARALEAAGVIPDVVFGSSLGELAALSVGKAVSAEDVLEACIIQAGCLERRCAPGGMVAILESPSIFGERAWLRGASLAAVSLTRHFVVAASADECTRIVTQCRSEELPHQRLPVRVAFHSDAMDPAREEFLQRTAHIRCQRPALRVLSACRAAYLEDVSPRTFWDVVRERIRLRDALDISRELLPCIFVDLGPGGTLSTFVKHHLALTARGACVPIISPFGTDVDNLRKVVDAVHAGS